MIDQIKRDTQQRIAHIAKIANEGEMPKAVANQMINNLNEFITT